MPINEILFISNSDNLILVRSKDAPKDNQTVSSKKNFEKWR